MVGPLIWLLVFDAVVALIWWVATGLIGITVEATLGRLIMGLVILINVVVLIVWLMALLGMAPSGLLEGPKLR